MVKVKNPQNKKLLGNYYNPLSEQQLSVSSSLFIIPIFIPHWGCPHRCVFCNQHVITGEAQYSLSINQINDEIQRYLRYRTAKRTTAQISFYGGNFLGLEPNLIKELLSIAEQYVYMAHIEGIRFSSRPDTITAENIALIRPYSVKTIEIGVQSMNDSVLRASHRGHTALDAEKAVEILKRQGYEIGVQLMVGLPEDNDAGLAETVQRVIAMQPDFVRIYPTLVIHNSLLARLFQRGEYVPLSLENSVSKVKFMYLQFSAHGIKVARMGLQADIGLTEGGNIVAGPYHPAFGHLVREAVFFDKAAALLQDKQAVGWKIPALMVNPRSLSLMKGLNNQNIIKLRKRFGLTEIIVITQADMPRDEVFIREAS